MLIVDDIGRRHFLRETTLRASMFSATGLLSACDGPQAWDRSAITVDRPGMQLGHAMRDAANALGNTRLEVAKRCHVLVIGSGIAGLSAIWHLRRQGVKDVLLLDGPEFMGNAAGHQFASGERGPTGAHYLPLPSQESRHVREILKAMQVFSGEIGAPKPTYDERVLVHAPAERLLRDAAWDASLMPQVGLSSEAAQQQSHFVELTKTLSNTLGTDGKRVFVVPIALASMDPQWLALDQVSFKTWLAKLQFSDPSLLWYLDYCCRDEFGAGIEQVSAWAGLHYFASRAGHASNAEDGAVLTWPDGLASIAQFLSEAVQGQRHAASALQLHRQANGVHVVAFDHKTQTNFGIHARKVVLATPAHIAARIDPEIPAAFPQWRTLLPSYAPWIVGNFKLRRKLPEQAGAGLSWDNVIFDSAALGYVNASQQLIRVDEFAAPTLTSYCVLNNQAEQQARKWCATASTAELLAVAGQDLEKAYGTRFWRDVLAAHITVRAHGMPAPDVGFLKNPLLTALRKPNGNVWYANADLSGYSVFEEASWWGMQVHV